MKTKIATALSVAGVLAAGSAAALVNTQILDEGTASSSASAAVLPPASSVDVTVPEAIDDTVPPTTAVETTTTMAPATTVPETTAPETSTTVAAPSEFLTAFNVGDAGVVTVDVIDGDLIVVSAEAKAGWDVTSVEEDDDEVEVEFRSATVRIEFEAELIDGQIVPHVESYRIGGSSGPVGTAPANTVPYDDDDDDDDEHDDDHDDEYDDEDDDSDDDDDEYDDDEDDDSDEDDEDDEDDDRDDD